mgnify:CR=1 FL=1
MISPMIISYRDIGEEGGQSVVTEVIDQIRAFGILPRTGT